MIELPGSLREYVIERIDEELESTGAKDPSGWVTCLLAALDSLAEEIDEDMGENLIPTLETSGELDEPLSSALASAFAALTTDDPGGEDLIGVVNKLCEIAWIDEEGDDEIAKGFMDSPDDFEDEEF